MLLSKWVSPTWQVRGEGSIILKKQDFNLMNCFTVRINH
jgi:hypothetical protein